MKTQFPLYLWKLNQTHSLPGIVKIISRVPLSVLLTQVKYFSRLYLEWTIPGDTGHKRELCPVTAIDYPVHISDKVY